MEQGKMTFQCKRNFKGDHDKVMVKERRIFIAALTAIKDGIYEASYENAEIARIALKCIDIKPDGPPKNEQLQ